MILSPILGSELRAVARRAKSYRLRSSLAIALSLAVVGSFAAVERATGGRLSVHETSLMAQYVFAALAGIQVVLTVGLVPALLAGAIAQERERRTLDSLLTTRLSSTQIVLGKLSSGLLQFAACLLTTLPIAIFLSLLGGVDPRLVLLVYAGTASVAFFVAGLSLLVSTTERRAGRAVNQTIALASAWFILPAVLKALLPRMFPFGWYWIRSCNAWLDASSPNSVVEVWMRSGVGPLVIESIFWMIGLQLMFGCGFLIWSIARLRPTSRGRAEGSGLGSRLSHLWMELRRCLFGRRPCGEDPVLWKEIHTSRMPGIAEILGAIVALGLLGLIGWGTYYFGRPAFMERYWMDDVTPHPDARRIQFNQFLSHVSSWIEFFLLLIVAGNAAGAVTLERAQDTWVSLIATPLSGREILRAKMIATVWKARWGFAVLIVLWSLGLVAGSLHPLGFGAAFVVLGVSVWFMTAIGTYVSLISRDSAQASNRALVPALLLSCSFLVCYFPSRYTTVFMGVGSSPFVNWICLVSPGEIRDVMSGAPTFRRLDQLGVPSYESPMRVLAACLCSVAGFAMGAAHVSGLAFARFDRVVGRPVRASERVLARSAAKTRPVRRKRAIAMCVSIVILMFLAMCIWFEAAGRPLRDALAETDRQSPGWQLDELEAARKRTPDAENGALRVIGAAHLLPPSWHSAGNEAGDSEQWQSDSLGSLLPLRPLDPAFRRSMRARVERASPALAEALGLAELPSGRFPVAWSRDGVSTPLPHLARIRDVANLLLCDAILEAETARSDRALTACRALINLGRSIGDEPALVSQRVRMELREITGRQVERALAHGFASGSALAAMQIALDAEEREPVLAFGIRGERALLDRFLSAIDAGQFTQAQLERAGFAFSDDLVASNAELRAAGLHFHNRAEKIASLPAEEQLSAFEQLIDDARRLSKGSRMLTPPILHLAKICLKGRARLRCAATGLACERYRSDCGSWPSTFDDLVPRFIPSLPVDPFDGKPLRFRRANGQITIYSVGENGRDDGGQTESDPRSSSANDLEFHLRDVLSRH